MALRAAAPIIASYCYQVTYMYTCRVPNSPLDLLVDTPHPGSQFWNSIQKIKWVFGLGAKHLVRNGTSTRLWHDWWLGSGPLRDRFLSLFAITGEPEAPQSL
jgi:hypothetical protein